MSKKVFCYSTMHSGTWFTIRLLESAVESSSGLLGDAEMIARGREYNLEDEKQITFIDNDWFCKNIEQYMTEEEKEKDLYVIHGHHKDLESKLPSIIAQQAYKEIPIIIPMRDPLLSINTFIWREHADYNKFIATESAEDRAARTHLNIELTKDILEIPRDRAFLMPIDGGAAYADKKRLAETALQYCRLPLTNKAISYIEEWAPQNKSENAPRVVNTEHDNTGFQKIKELYRNKDKNGLREMLSVEMDIIERDEELKLFLKEAGYEDLFWW